MLHFYLSFIYPLHSNSSRYLQYAIQFTPQYGDSFIEYLRLIYLRCSRLRSSTILQCSKRRFMHYLHNEVEIEAMQQEYDLI